MASDKLTLRVERTRLIRLLGERMREKREEFEKEKKKLPERLAKVRHVARIACKDRLASIEVAKTLEEISSCLSEDLLAYSTRNKMNLSTPELNLCKEQEFMTALQNDARKIIPLSSDHWFWSFLKEKCEPERAA